MKATVDRRTGLEELDRDECLALLGHTPLGRLAVVVDGQPLVFPVNFVLDGTAIVLRTDAGTKLLAARTGAVAFECDGIDVQYHTGWSVLVVAVVEEISNATQIARLERLPLRPWCHGPKSTWLRLRAKSITGRRIPPPGRTNPEECS